MQLNPGDILCKEGDFRNALFIVKKGSLEGSALHSNKKVTYNPGSIIGEFSLVENVPCVETITAVAESEVQVITNDVLQETLQQEPSWVGSIIDFLSKRTHMAQRDHHNAKKIKSLPGLLYVLKNRNITANEEISLSTIQSRMDNLLGLTPDLIQELLQILEELDLLKTQGNAIKVKNPNVIELLYQSILHRAVKKTMSPNILSITEQMVLTAVIKTVQKSSEPLQDGTCIIPTPTLIAVAKKVTHGMTLTMRNMMPLLDKKILQTTTGAIIDSGTPIETIESFQGDFDSILDLMELNRVFPLLDKKLVC